jgi:acetate kinase
VKILVLNSGSSSIKFKLFEMDRKTVLASGICEKIGEENGSVEINRNSAQALKRAVAIKDHNTGFILAQELLGSLGIVDDFRNRLE